VSTCPESVYGVHDNTDKQGRCLLCRHKIDKAMPFTPDERNRSQARRAQDPLSIDGPDEGDYLDGYGGVM
jgi:hypothetical protein